jgi:hypothetical protein
VLTLRLGTRVVVSMAAASLVDHNVLATVFILELEEKETERDKNSHSQLP